MDSKLRKAHPGRADEDFPSAGGARRRLSLATDTKIDLPFSEKLVAREKEMIEAALSESGGRVFGPLGAATRLGMPRSTLESKIRSLKIDKNRFKTADSPGHD